MGQTISRRCTLIAALTLGLCAPVGAIAQQSADPLPSWNDGRQKVDHRLCRACHDAKQRRLRPAR